MSEPRGCPENDPLCDGVMVRPPDYPPYPCPARQPASEQSSEQDVSLLIRALGQRLPVPGGISDIDCLEAATRIKAALAAARGGTP